MISIYRGLNTLDIGLINRRLWCPLCGSSERRRDSIKDREGYFCPTLLELTKAKDILNIEFRCDSLVTYNKETKLLYIEETCSMGYGKDLACANCNLTLNDNVSDSACGAKWVMVKLYEDDDKESRVLSVANCTGVPFWKIWLSDTRHTISEKDLRL